jgi:hypothetical protein
MAAIGKFITGFQGFIFSNIQIVSITAIYVTWRYFPQFGVVVDRRIREAARGAQNGPLKKRAAGAKSNPGQHT